MITWNDATHFIIGGGAHGGNGWQGLFVHKDPANTDNADEIGLSFHDNTREGSGVGKSLSGVVLSQTEAFKLRLTFEQGSVTDQWHIGVWVNDIYQTTLTYIGMYLGTTLLIYGDNTDTVMNIADADNEYTELTFSDWGITNGQYEDGNSKTYTLNESTGLTSLNGTIFEGNIANSTAGEIRIGNGWEGIAIQGTSTGLKLFSWLPGHYDNDTTAGYRKVAYEDLTTTSFKLKLTIDCDAYDNIFMGVWINDEFQRYVIFDYMADALGTDMLMTAAGITLSNAVAPKDITWKNFGIGDYQEYRQGDIGKVFYESTSLVNTSFRGKVCFNKNSADSGDYYICYGANGTGWDGLRIVPQQDGTLGIGALVNGDYGFYETIAAPADLGTFLGQSFELGLDLIKSGKDILVSVYINGVLQNETSYLWTEAIESGWLGTNVNFICPSAEDTIIVGEKPTLTDITLADFDIVYKVCDGEGYFTYESDSLIGTSFGDLVLFNKVNEDSGDYYICYAAAKYGAWDGFRLAPTASGQLKIYDPYDEAALGVTLDAPEALGSFVGTPFQLGIEFWTCGNDAKINIYANGTLCNADPIVWEEAVTNERIGKYMTVIASTSGDAIVLGEEQPPEQLPTNFMEITLNDFGIVDGTYDNLLNQSLVVNGVTDLDRKILSADISLNQGEYQMFYGKTQDALNGLYFFFDRNNNKITLNQYVSAGNYTGGHVFEASDGGFDLTSDNPTNLKITTEYIDNDNEGTSNDVKIGVFINGVLYDNKYIVFNNYTGYMSSYVSLYQHGSVDYKLTISNPKRLLPTDYEQATFSTVGMADVEEAEYGSAWGVDTLDWNGLIFSGKAQLQEGIEIRFDAYVGWEGLQFQMASNTLVFNDAGEKRFSGNLATWADVDAGEWFTFSIATKYLDLDDDGNVDDMKLGLWVDEEMYGNRWFYILDYVRDDNSMYAFSYNMNSNAADGSKGWCSLASYYPSTISGSYDNGKYYYNINEGGYLLSGANITVNGVAKNSGEMLQTVGDYAIVRTEGNADYTTTIVLWSYGDAHPDGKTSAADLIAIKKAILQVSLTTDSGLKGADITKDGNINAADLTMIRNVLLGEETLDTTYSSTALSYATGDSKVMPIGGFWGPYGSLVNEDVFANLKDMGINLLTYSSETYGVAGETDSVIESLELAEKYNISMFIRDNNLSNESYTSEDLAQKIASYSKYQSFQGLTGLDEPSASDGTYGTGVSGWLNDRNQLASSVNSYANLTTYVNMYPLDSNIGDATAYENYLDEYCKNYNPKMLSYDDYLFLETSVWGSYVLPVVDCGDYFENLAIIREKAQEYNIPFWSFVQAGVWKETDATLTPAIDQSKMKWQANMALAFGAKGIQYFPVINPSEKDTTLNWMESGLLDINGATTEWSEYAKNINAQIAAIDEVLMNSTNDGIMVVGYYANKNISDCGVPIKTTYEEVTSITTSETNYSSYGAVAGCFDYNGKTALYVVNYNTNKKNNVTLTFKEECTAQYIQNAGAYESTGSTLTLNLPAGEGALVVIE